MNIWKQLVSACATKNPSALNSSFSRKLNGSLLADSQWIRCGSVDYFLSANHNIIQNTLKVHSNKQKVICVWSSSSVCLIKIWLHRKIRKSYQNNIYIDLVRLWIICSFVELCRILWGKIVSSIYVNSNKVQIVATMCSATRKICLLFLIGFLYQIDFSESRAVSNNSFIFWDMPTEINGKLTLLKSR